MREIGLTHTAALIAVFISALAVAASGPTNAFAQSADGSSAPICLLKTDRTGGELGFIVLPQDAAMFESAGFSAVSCPASLDSAATHIAARCTRFRGFSAGAKAFIADLYGLSVDQMCAASDAWTQSRAAP